MIRVCTCKHSWQDETYGPGMRVHNKCSKGWRCTVCSNVKTEDHQGMEARAAEKAMEITAGRGGGDA